MPDVIRNVLKGFSSVIVRAPGMHGCSTYVFPKNCFREDRENLRRDIRAVCGDVSVAVEKTGIRYNG